MTTSNGVETYEDMFKEITRKLYGEETGHGLHTLGTPVAHVATGGPTVPEGERSFTTLMTDRSLTSVDYEQSTGETTNDHLTTAFGLAALMQNGFGTTSSVLNINPQQFAASANVKTTNASATITTSSSSSTSVTPGANTATSSLPSTNSGEVSNEDRWRQSQTDDCMPWTSTPKISNNFNTSNNKKSKTRENNNGNNQQSQDMNTSQAPIAEVQRRFSCTSCTYSTDRRDLYLRHQNIHNPEKPFHCYVCMRQFNRADHVKKHFTRIHRDMTYDNRKTRRSPGAQTNSTVKTENNTYFSGQVQHQQNQQQQANQSQNQITLNIPSATYNSNGNQHHDQQAATILSVSELNMGNVSRQQNTLNIPQKSLVNKPASTNGQDKKVKVKSEKRFTCSFCPWSGSDNWGLKRHLNTHTKPFVCTLCDYRAARSERLATHVLRMHSKRACKKCNFLADDDNQLKIHQTEAHANESRPARNSGNSSGGTTSTTNVLRAITNNFIASNQLTNIQNIASTNNIFGNGTSQANTLFSNNLNTTRIPDLTNGSWRSNVSALNESLPTNQKRGAERLFQYFEADGSDPEDYSRLLQMAAISRNTASVAQDFHNAGGGIKRNSSFIKNESNEYDDEGEQLDHQSPSLSNTQATTTNSHNSPPASTNNENIKRRRFSSSHNKENNNMALSNGIATQLQNYIRDLLVKRFMQGNFDTSNLSPEDVVKHFIKTEADNLMRAGFKPPSSEDPKDISEVLKNRNELTISIEPSQPVIIKNEMNHSEKRNRKQMQPRKIEQMEEDGNCEEKAQSNIYDRIRDKYLNQMVSQGRKSCFVCSPNTTSLTIPYHTTSSLIIHKLWRHSRSMIKCKKCDKTFKRDYSFKIHQRIKHCRLTRSV